MALSAFSVSRQSIALDIGFYFWLIRETDFFFFPWGYDSVPNLLFFSFLLLSTFRMQHASVFRFIADEKHDIEILCFVNVAHRALARLYNVTLSETRGEKTCFKKACSVGLSGVSHGKTCVHVLVISSKWGACEKCSHTRAGCTTVLQVHSKAKTFDSGWRMYHSMPHRGGMKLAYKAFNRTYTVHIFLEKSLDQTFSKNRVSWLNNYKKATLTGKGKTRHQALGIKLL